MLEARAALAAWGLDEPLRSPAVGGLINRTFLVGDPVRSVLQWVSPIFDPRIHSGIDAVTRRLEAAGMATPRLVPTPDGRLWVETQEVETREGEADASGCWRLLTFVPGVTVERVEGAGRAAAAGDLVGRFHAALAGWSHEFAAPRRSIHDTPARMAELTAALAVCDGHPLAAPVRDLGRRILDAWSTWEGELDLPERICHGDLKIANLRFSNRGEGLALVDLDTVGPMPLPVEMGDAWRSWANPAGEDAPAEARLDVDRFAASAIAWLEALGRAGVQLEPIEHAALVPSIERIALELAARFAADAVENRYFREAPGWSPQPGRHNLDRALGQFHLAVSARSQRTACLAALASPRRSR